MRLLSSLLQCCALLGCASAQQGLLYTFADRSRDTSSPAIISSDTAYSILARRQSSTEGLSLQGVDEHTLEQISKHEGFQEPLFGDGKDTERTRVFVRITGQSFDNKKSEQIQPEFIIQQSTTDLLSTFSVGKTNDETQLCKYEAITRDSVKFSITLSSLIPCSSQRGNIISSEGHPIDQIVLFAMNRLGALQDHIFDVATFYVDFSEAKLSSKLVNKQIDQLISFADANLSNEHVQTTLLILPSPSKLNKPKSKPFKRQIEEPLDLELVTSTPTPLKSNSTLPIPTRFPACFTSKSACTNGTNACSGRGTCSLSGGCYTCHCERTLVRTNPDGSKKTVAWGGAACQKKDISVEFFLFAGFGIAMTALVTGAIGMLYTMGSQELPSVIGAGVAGVRPK